MKQVWKNNKWIRTTALVLAMLILAFLYAHVGKNHYYYDRSADTGSFVMMPPAASGESVEETFVSAENAIDGINIKCSQIGDVSAVTLHVRILASDGRTVLSEAEVPVADFKNNRFNKIKLDKVKDVRDKSLILSLSQTGADQPQC